MKLSIIIPFYKDIELFEPCLDSISLQSYTEWEAILVDDCGGDGSLAIAQKFTAADPRFKIISHPKNRGVSAARNTGTDTATGDYVFYMDADDSFLTPETLGTIIAQTSSNPDYIQIGYIHSNGKKVAYPSKTYHTHSEIQQDYTTLNFTNANAKLISLPLLRKHKIGFDEGIIYEDVLFAVKLYTKSEHIISMSDCLYYHNLRQGSLMHSEFTKHKIESLKHIILEMNKLPSDKNIDYIIDYFTAFIIKNLMIHKFKSQLQRHGFTSQLQRHGFESQPQWDIGSNANGVGTQIPTSE